MIRSLLRLPRLNIKAILSVLSEKIKEDAEADIFRNYMASCARIITENTAAVCNGSFITAQYQDIIHNRLTDSRTAEDIISEVVSGAGLEVI